MQTDLNTAMKVQRILKDARQLLTGPGAWCQGGMAKNGLGQNCGAFATDAVAFDAIGAIYRCAGEDSESAVAARMEVTAFIPFHGVWELSRFNDDPAATQAKVLEMFDRAIVSLKSDINAILRIDTRK